MYFNVDVKELINDIENRIINCCYLIIKSLSIPEFLPMNIQRYLSSVNVRNLDNSNERNLNVM